MARRRRMTALQRKYFGKKRRHRRRKHKKARHHVAKRRRRRHHTRRRRSYRRHHYRRRRRHGGGGKSIMPHREDLHLMGAAAVIGFAEAKAKADATFILNKVPRPIKQLGYTGGTWLALTIANYVFPNRILQLGKRAAGILTAYQFGALQKQFDSADKPLSLSGFDDEHMIDVGTLSAEGEAMQGVPFDDAVAEGMT